MSEFKGVIGFDLGTTNSCISIKVDTSIPKVVKLEDGELTKSIVGIDNMGNIVVGKRALDTGNDYALSFKHDMGYNRPNYKIADKTYTAEQLSSILVSEMLKQLYTMYPEYRDIKDIVVSHPAYFNTNQISATKEAFKDTGYNVVGLYPEPTAAAIVYQTQDKIEKPIVVFDLGGGTFDVVLLRSNLPISNETVEFYKTIGVELPQSERVLEVLNINGDNNLGGDTIDHYNMEYLRDKHKLVINEDLRRAVQYVKDTGINKYIGDVTIGKNEITYGVDKVYKRCKELMDVLLQHEKEQPVVVLCGGSTKSEYIRGRLKESFREVKSSIDPDKSVAIGNALLGSMLSEDAIIMINRSPKFIGVESSKGFRPIIKKGDIYPTSKTETFRNKVPFKHLKGFPISVSENLKSSQMINLIELKDLGEFDSEGYVYYSVTITYTKGGFLTATIKYNDKDIELPLTYNEADTIQSSVSDKIANSKVANQLKALGLEKPEFAKDIQECLSDFEADKITERDLFRVYREMK